MKGNKPDIWHEVFSPKPEIQTGAPRASEHDYNLQEGGICRIYKA